MVFHGCAAVKADGADDSVDDVIADFNATLAKWYPGLNPQTVFPSWSPLRTALPHLPSLASVTTRRFATESELRTYIKSVDYHMNGDIAVCVGLVVLMWWVRGGCMVG